MNTAPKFKNTFNAHTFTKKYEKNTKPSVTVPDQTMSLREILTRYAHGLPIDSMKTPIYEGEEYVPDPQFMDLADREEFKKQAYREIEETKQKFEENQKNFPENTKTDENQ